MIPSVLDLAVEDGAVVFVDLPPAVVLAATDELNRRGFFVVPIIQRWVVQAAVVDCRALAGRLVIDGQHVRRPSSPRGVIFVLDGERSGPPGAGSESRPPRRFDNRYAYSPDRFPSPAFLQSQGIVAAQWLAGAVLADDLHGYSDDLARAFPAVTGHRSPGTPDALARR